MMRPRIQGLSVRHRNIVVRFDIWKGYQLELFCVLVRTGCLMTGSSEREIHTLGATSSESTSIFLFKAMLEASMIYIKRGQSENVKQDEDRKVGRETLF